jgi:hypothetical protein
VVASSFVRQFQFILWRLLALFLEYKVQETAEAAIAFAFADPEPIARFGRVYLSVL